MKQSLSKQINNVAIVGGGFTGLATAYYLAKSGKKVTVFESESQCGGLAGSFLVNGVPLEKFYHHWFTTDVAMMSLIAEIGLSSRVTTTTSKTGIYYANKFYKLASPLDLLKFKPLSIYGRLRLGIMTIYVRQIKNWKSLEKLSASEWLRQIYGLEVYKIVWEPLLKGKFGSVADDVGAVWMWNKLKLRGGSRGKGGKEMLAYFNGGFSEIIEVLVKEIHSKGGQVLTGAKVTEILVEKASVVGVVANDKKYLSDVVVATSPLPVAVDLIRNYCKESYIQKLMQIKFLGNTCIVLELKKSLSSTYWLNINDPNFPFIAIIEHTNFHNSKNYNGSHIVYLSKYLLDSHELFNMPDNEVISYGLRHLKKLFPSFDDAWIINSYVWRANYSQPIITKNYSQKIPKYETPINGFYLATMAQIYPEDRGTNYAVLQGKRMAEKIVKNN